MLTKTNIKFSIVINRIPITIIFLFNTFLKSWSFFIKTKLNLFLIIELFIRIVHFFPLKIILSLRYLFTIFEFTLLFHCSVCIIVELISTYKYISNLFVNWFTNFISLDIIIILWTFSWLTKVPLLDRSITIKNDVFSAIIVPPFSKLTFCNQIPLLVITLSA
jgi:hypothetical protein